jgi:hypothetical protein
VQHVSKTLLVLTGAIEASCAAAPHSFSRPTVREETADAYASTSRQSDLGPQKPAADVAHVDDRTADVPPRWVTLEAALTVATPDDGKLTIVAGKDLRRDTPPALITVLHANCVESTDNCSFLRELADGRAVLVCPMGNVPCGNGGAVWGGGLQALVAIVERALGTAESTLGETRPRMHDVLFGSSGGAFAARNLINSGRTGWFGLVLVGAKIQLDLAATRRAGVHRVLLAAPDGDAAASAMRAEKTTLCRAGIPARFISLGSHGHGMDDASPAKLAVHMDWVMGITDDEPSPVGCP